jgi:hypothetical protein
LSSVPFNVDVAYVAGRAPPPPIEGMSRYRLFFVNYCQFRTLKFIAGLLWVTGLWTMVVMPDGILPPLLHTLILLVQPSIAQWRKDTNVRRI